MTALEHWSRRAQSRSELSLSDEWKTPPWLFAWAQRRYGRFLLDAAAARWNHQCSKYFTKEDNALVRPWLARSWCNPPYSRGLKKLFLAHGRLQVLHGEIDLVAYLLPHDTADGYWRDFVEAPAGRLLGVSKCIDEVGTLTQTRWSGLTLEKTEINRRLRYQHNDGSRSCRPGTARHSSALVVFTRPGVLRPLVQASAHGKD